jgi:PmbA protein
LAQKAGIQDCWLHYRHRLRRRCAVQDGRPTERGTEEATEICLRIWDRGRHGQFHTTDLDGEALSRFFEDARSRTARFPANPLQRLPVRTGSPPTLDLQLDDPQVRTLDPTTQEEWCLRAEAECRSHEDARSAHVELEAEILEEASLSSNGFEGEQTGTRLQATGTVAVREGREGRLEGRFRWEGRYWVDLGTPEGFGTLALEGALRRKEARPAPEGPWNLVLEAPVASLLLSELLKGMEGASLLSSSPASARLRATSFPACMRVVDDPLLLRGLGSRLYDGEGRPAAARPLLVGGKFQGGWLNAYEASKLGTIPSSDAPSNCRIEPGNTPVEGLLGGRGLRVTGLAAGGVDAWSGDSCFLLECLEFEDGRVGGPVNGAVLAGALADLWAHTTAVGNDPGCGAICSPSVRWEGVG